jgi:hypothetical protein
MRRRTKLVREHARADPSSPTPTNPQATARRELEASHPLCCLAFVWSARAFDAPPDSAPRARLAKKWKPVFREKAREI